MKKQIILDGIIFDYYIYTDGKCQNIITNNFLIMNRFNKETFSNFLKWIQEIKKEEICNDFLNEEDNEGQVWVNRCANGEIISELYYDINADFNYFTMSRNINDGTFLFIELKTDLR